MFEEKQVNHFVLSGWFFCLIQMQKNSIDYFFEHYFLVAQTSWKFFTKKKLTKNYPTQKIKSDSTLDNRLHLNTLCNFE